MPTDLESVKESGRPGKGKSRLSLEGGPPSDRSLELVNLEDGNGMGGIETEPVNQEEEEGESMVFSKVEEFARAVPLLLVALPAPASVVATPGAGQLSEKSGDLRGPTRASARLLAVAKGSALDRAKSRKACLLEGDSGTPRNLTRKWSCKKVAARGEKCGVKLTEGEAEKLHKFILRG